MEDLYLQLGQVRGSPTPLKKSARPTGMDPYQNWGHLNQVCTGKSGNRFCKLLYGLATTRAPHNLIDLIAELCVLCLKWPIVALSFRPCLIRLQFVTYLEIRHSAKDDTVASDCGFTGVCAVVAPSPALRAK